jgi:hypothetical protein
MSPSDTPKDGSHGEPTKSQKDGKGDNEASGIHAPVLTGPPQRKSHASKWQKTNERAREAFDNTIWFFRDPTRSLAFLTLLLVGIGVSTLWIQRDTEQRQLRAYVGMGAIGSAFYFAPQTQTLSLRSRIINTGLTPAFQTITGAAVKIFPYPATEEMLRQTKIVMHAQDLTLFPQQFTDVVGKFDSPISQRDLNATLQDNKRKIYNFGTVTYVDAFGASHWTHFCHSFSANIDVSNMQIGQGNDQAISAEACPFWNNSD